MIKKVVVGVLVVCGLLLGSSGLAVAAPAIADAPVLAVVPAPVQDPPPVGSDPATGRPYAPCGPANDGQHYYTQDSQGKNHQWVCSGSKGEWLEIFEAG